ncbi:cation-independent mannose-6-phosphate receptor-like [Rhincodon typus]|uniref:cation-independent mannose-6-phosphate receptor-like n=1 Tax=Rhincodon typus TaxID=259920 RepID=UPI0020300F21|nr:cation-independent mannose-6-phosphate receptor-like [Rhincodon typus]
MSGRMVPFGFFRAVRWLLLAVSCCVWNDAQADDVFVYPELCGYTWEAMDSQKGIYYKINLCSPLNCGSLSAICAYNSSQKANHSVGDYAFRTRGVHHIEYNTTQKCTKQNSNQTVQSSINFLCGKTLGSPEFVTTSECVHYFEWKTFVACKKSTFNPHKEVPCYVIDEVGKKRDLNPLIKMSGGYLVDSPDDDDLYINICRDIAPSGQTSACKSGSSACLLKGSTAFDVGQPTDALKLVGKDRLMLRYAKKNNGNEKSPAFCGNHKPAVTITLICPSGRRQGTDPKLIASTNCRYEIEWVTEYACPRDYLESHNCKLVSDQHDISIDLTPLTLTASSNPYHVVPKKTDDTTAEYYYYLNVCGQISSDVCSDDRGFVASCQTKLEASFSKVAGRYENQTLRYSDGDLTLIYPDGNSCSSGFRRMTIINFYCNESAANGGKGEPEFSAEVDCTYIFDWGTKYACVKEKENLLCRASDGRKRYDLSPLTRYEAKEVPESDNTHNWEALDSLVKSDQKRIYINVCHKILQDGGAVGCPEDAAICAVGENNKKNLGKFVSSPEKEGNDLQLVYSDGEPCGTGGQSKTIITFICRPGDLESPPILKPGINECLYELEWHTAAACALSKTQGDECRVSDPEAGFVYDLSPLTKQNSSYQVKSETYNFYINVCGNVSKDGCEKNSGACQEAPLDQTFWSLGESNSRLSYYDGIIHLVYTNGTEYNNEQHIQRSTLITFLCDRDAGEGHPEFEVSENCQIKDPKYGYVIDLRPLANEDQKVKGDEYTYHFRVCDYLRISDCGNFSQGGEDAISACQSKPGTSFKKIAGHFTQHLTYEDGLIMINYTRGDTCHKIYERSTAIFFYCDHSQTPGKPVYLRETLDCTYLFEWHTSYACPPFRSIDCTLRDEDGNSYDLTPLSRSQDSWEIEQQRDIDQTYYINICKSLVPKNGNWACSLNAAVCLKNGSKYVNLGEVVAGPRWEEHGLLVLRYQNGDRCPDGIRNKTTSIRFKCDKDAINTKPDLITAIEGCEYTFLWFTAFACPVTKNVHNECVVTNPITGHLFDLNSLRTDQGYTIYDRKIRRNFVRLNICDKVQNTGCSGDDVGVCIQGDHAINAGRFNTEVTYIDQVLRLTYSEGDICSSNSNLRHRSIFSFVCGTLAGAGTGPVLVASDEQTCTHYFSWHTQLACEHEVRCSVKNGSSIIDLSPLIQKTGYYSAEDEDIADDSQNDSPDFYVNLCQPLNPVPGVICPPGSAVCMDPVNGPPVVS